IVVFPGSNRDHDAWHVARHVLGQAAVCVYHKETDLKGADAVILPGGFAYGDYLRAGVIARFSPVMRAVSAFAAEGGLVLGICNGFQVLAEAGLVPGALLRNRDLRFLGRDVRVVPERLDTPFTRALAGRDALRLPIAHGEGCYYADDATLDRLEADGQVLFRYAGPTGERAADGDGEANPNGSLRAIAGVLNAAGNVAGLMPHPERAAETVLGNDAGLAILRSLVDAAAERAAAGGPVLIGAPG
ncbi:MAG: phosphoribosylformylglycinamidine synthase subunit PurQ, partial [Candidatus Limnocylindrales bacterium]